MDTVLDGPASPRISERPQSLPEEVRAHFDGCPACRGQWHLLSRAEAALRAPRIVPAPAGMLAEFRDRLAAEDRHAERRPVNPFARWLWPMGSLAAAGLAAALVVSMNVQPHFVAQPTPSAPSDNTTMASGLTSEARTQRPADRLRELETQDLAAKVDDRFGRQPSNTRGDRAPKATVSPKKHEGERSLRLETDAALKDLPSLLERDAIADQPEDNARPLKTLAKTAEPVVAFDVTPPPRASKAKAKGNAKGIREPLYRFAKKAPEKRMADNPATPGESAPSEAAGAGSGLGGFGAAALGGEGFGASTPGGAAGSPAGPSVLAAKSDPNQRNFREERLDRLAVLAEQESLVAAEVSPALVTALQRPVSLKQRKPESVLTVLGRLSREADIEVQLEGKVSQLALTLQVPVKEQKADEQLLEKVRVVKTESQVPLWVALQSVALQGKLQIVPEENRLILRPLDAKAPNAAGKTLMTRQLLRPNMSLKREVRLQTPTALPAAAKPAPSQQNAATPAPAVERRHALYAAPAQPQAQSLYYFAYAELPNPDPRVWPSMWGDLPKWLFTLPEERPGKAPAAESK